jgi:hypothetical protein
MLGLFNTILTLSRISNLPTVWTNCLAAWAINHSTNKIVGQTPAWHDPSILEWGQLGWLLLGGSLAYSGGCILNDAFDQKFDQEFNPNRPIPSGKIKITTVWSLGLGSLIVGGIVLTFGALCSLIWTVALISSILLYDAFHKEWKGSVWVMGACRMFLWLTAGTAGQCDTLGLPLVIGSISLGGYVAGISLFARNESISRNSSRPSRLGISLLFSPCLIILGLLVAWNHLDPSRIFLANCSGLYLGWIIFESMLLMRKRGGNNQISQGVSMLLAGICLFDALALALFMPSLMAPCYLAQLFAKILQKKFAAT